MILQVNFEVVSALLLAGILFLFLGLMSLSRHGLAYYSKRRAFVVTTARQIPNHEPSIQGAKLSKYSTSPKKACPKCGESYPLDTIHTKCLLCGADL